MRPPAQVEDLKQILEIAMSSGNETVVPSSALPRVVVVGAGFGGLAAAKELAKLPVQVTIVDRRNFHLFQPLLYQVATAALDSSEIGWPVRTIFAAKENVRVLMMEVNSVDTVQKTISDGVTSLKYDYLVLATGATHSYFGHEEWSQFAPGLKTVDDARALRERLLRAFEQAELSTDPLERRRLLTTVIVGGGPTGVELAGAIAELANRTLTGEFRQIDPSAMRVILVEAADRLLTAFPPKLSTNCLTSLQKLNVEVRLNTSVTECNEAGVTLDGVHLPASTVIWAAGVQASNAAQWLNASHDKANRVIVTPELSIPDRPDVFVIGDTSHVVAYGKSVPGVAPAAKQMGQYVAKAIGRKVDGKKSLPPFAYKDQGQLAMIGRKFAVVDIGGVNLTGFTGWLFWSCVHILFLIGFRSKTVVAFEWAWSYFSRQHSARLLSDRATLAKQDRETAQKR
jgi:NADH:ubiquinone reductase (H+-translocating)